MSDLPDMTAPSPFDAAGNLIAPPMPQDFDALHALLAPALPQPQPDIPLPPVDTTLRAPAAESVAGPPTSAAELETPGVATPPAQSVAPSGPAPQPYGAELATPNAAGPPVAGVKDLTDVTTEAPTPGATPEERDFNAATTPEEREAAYNKLSPDQQDRVLTGEAERYANLPPEQRAKVDALREGVRLEKLNKGLLDAATADTKKAQENYAIYQKAQNDVRQRRQALQQQIEQLGQFKPQGIGVGQAIAGIVASVVGGFASPFTGGRNLGLEGFHKAIDMHAQEQRDEYERQRLALGAKQQLLNADEDQTQADFRTNEAQRALGQEQLIRQLQAEAQNYDPRSTTVARIGQAIVGTRAQQAAALDALDQRNLKNTIDTAKAQVEVEKGRSEAMKNQAETMKIMGKLGGTGVAAPTAATGTLKMGATVQNPTNPAYSVVVGADDPFTHEPLLSRYSLDKEQMSKQRDLATTTSEEYKRLRSLYGEMKSLVDEGKGWDEVITRGATRTTRGERYDELRGQVVSVLAKLNDGKTNIGILDLNEGLVPERKTSLSLSDAGQLLTDAMRDTDTKVDSAFSAAGIDASGIIRHAQQASAPAPQQSAADREEAARENLSSHPDSPDAQAEYNNAQFHGDIANTLAQTGQSLVSTFKAAPPMPKLPVRKEAGSGDEFSDVRQANKFVQDFNEQLHEFQKQAKDTSYLGGVNKKNKGDVQAAEKKRADQLRGMVSDVASAHSKAIEAINKARESMHATDVYLRGQQQPAPSGPQSHALAIPPELTLPPTGGR